MEFLKKVHYDEQTDDGTLRKPFTRKIYYYIKYIVEGQLFVK